MDLPNVNITLTNGALGTPSGSTDGIAAMVLTGVATPELTLGTPKVIYSLPDAVALGITAVGSNADAHRHIKEFYEGYSYITGREVAELYIMLVVNTQTMTVTCDSTSSSGAGKVLDFAKGRVRLLGVARTPGVGYTPTLTDGIDGDCITAIQKAHLLGNVYAAKQQPIRTLVEARAFVLANVGDLKDLHTYTYNRAGLVMMSSSNDGSSSVGLVLGIEAGLKVHVKASRVRNTALPIAKAYIGDTEVTPNLGAISTIHDKGYIIARMFPTRSGYYINADFMACPLTDDYALLCRGRVIDKAQLIAYDTYLDEVDEDAEVDRGTGFWVDGYVEFMRNRITNALNNQMGESMSGSPIVNLPPIDVLALAKTRVQLKIVPKGYNTNIDVDLGFSNPALN
jgi:hypothetical protein